MEYTFYRIKSKNVEIREFYIGSTKDYNARKSKHKSDCNNEDSPAYNTPVYQYIRSNGGWDEWEFEIIDKIICCETDRFLHEDKLTELYGATLNSRRSIITKEEINEKARQYHAEHREKRNEKNRKYREEHREERNEYNRKYHEEHREEINEKKRQYRLRKKLEKINK